MELGALVCAPRAPACLACPWRAWCAAAAGGAPETYPRKAARRERPVRFATAFLLERAGDGAFLFRRRPLEGLLGGMMELPSTPWLDASVGEEKAVAHAPVAPAGGWRPVAGGPVVHGFTHFELRFALLRGRAEGPEGPAGAVWARPEAFGELALPTMTLRLLRHAGLPVPRAGGGGGSGAPRVGKVQRQAPGRDGHDVEAAGEAGEPWPTLEEEGCRARDPLALAGAHRLERVAGGLAPLHLDEDEEAAAPRDQVDLAQGAGEAAGEDGEAFQPEQQRRRGLRPAADQLTLAPPPLPGGAQGGARRARARR
jgi:hypothetical protein